MMISSFAVESFSAMAMSGTSHRNFPAWCMAGRREAKNYQLRRPMVSCDQRRPSVTRTILTTTGVTHLGAEWKSLILSTVEKEWHGNHHPVFLAQRCDKDNRYLLFRKHKLASSLSHTQANRVVKEHDNRRQAVGPGKL